MKTYSYKSEKSILMRSKSKSNIVYEEDTLKYKEEQKQNNLRYKISFSVFHLFCLLIIN